MLRLYYWQILVSKKRGEKMIVTKNLAQHVHNIGINLSDLSRKTNIPYASLYKSLGPECPQRELRADELTSICVILGINPVDLWTKESSPPEGVST